MEIKKKKRFCGVLKDVGLLLLVFSLFMASSYAGYLGGYYYGKQDGYASGYINGASGVYAEQASDALNRSFIGDLRVYYQRLSKFVSKKCDLLFDEKYKNADSAQYDYLRIDDSVSSTGADELVWALGRIPTKLLEHYNQNGWVVILNNDAFAMKYQGNENYVADGYIDYTKTTIYLSAKADDLANVVAHEFGHYFDYVCSRLSNSDEWRECYLAEWDEYYAERRDFHAIGTESEYFAGAFSMYVEQPNKLKEICPMSYQFIHEALCDFNDGGYE